MKNEDTITVIKELMTSFKTAINAEIKASGDITNLRIDQVIDHQKKTNGMIAENKKNIKKLETQTRFIRWVHRNPQFSIPLLVILAFGIYFIVVYIGIEFLFTL